MLTPSSSAEILPFEPKPLGFAQTSKGWIKPLLAEGCLTRGNKLLATRIYLSFSYEEFEKTGILIGWESWETMADGTGLSRSSVARGLKKLERFGALRIIHGGRDPKTGYRLHNKYLAKFNHIQVSPVRPGQVSNPGVTSDTRLGELDSVNQRGKKDFGLPRKEGKTESEEKKKRRRWLAEGKSEFTVCPIWKRPTL
jgi:hypothetical protein